MERLLASQMSQGPLIEQKDASGQSVFVPVKESAPMPVPKPRGIPGLPVIPHFKQSTPGIGSASPVTYADVPSANSEPSQSAKTVAAAANAAPQSLTWADHADSWMSEPSSEDS